MNFAAQIKDFAVEAKGITAGNVRALVMEIGRRVVMRSPVGNRELWAINKYRAEKGLPPTPAGYAGGRFRANWQYGTGTVPSGEVAAIDATGSVSLKSIAGVMDAKVSEIHYIANNLPYSEHLENGGSTQAPGGMVELTMLEVPAMVKIL